MLVLPIPMVASLAILLLLVRCLLRRDRSRLFVALLALAAAQGAIVSLVQHYGVTALRPLQPVSATLLPPLAWLTFTASARRRLRPARDGRHLAVPAATAAMTLAAPGLLDLWLPAVFAAYGGAILLALRGRDALALARLDAGAQPARVWAGVAATLLLSALSDALIGAAMAAGLEGLRLPLVSLFTALSLVLIGVLAVAESLAGDEPDAAEGSPPEDAPAGADEADPARRRAVMAALEAAMAGAKPYLDPDLTLDRLARRLRLPMRDISRAINASTGENASRYVNGFRIRHACALMREGASVTEALLASGFNTKSNFNREFRRVVGVAPTEWLELEAAGPARRQAEAEPATAPKQRRTSTGPR
jgi:AraC-like DNA-binding protein